jgi:transposase-like protein
MQMFLSRDRRKKVGWAKEFLINTLYGFGLNGTQISRFVGVSRATVYRHIHR